MQDKELRRMLRLETLRESIAKVTDEKLTWSEIKKRVAQGDIIYIIALTVAKRKIEELENRKASSQASKYMQIYESTHLLSYILVALYMSLSFFQKPSWCRSSPIYLPDQNTYYDDCTGTSLEGNVIPVSNIPYLKNWQLIIVEVICVTLLTARRYIKQIVKKKTSWTLIKVTLCITLLVYLSEILQYGVGLKFPLNQFLRPIYFVAYIQAVRSNLYLYCRIVWRSKEIFIVIAGIFLFFVCIARVLFYQTEQNEPSIYGFDSFANTIYHLFVMLTTANYPDVMMPIFTVTRYSSLYFIGFMMVLNLVLLNIILAYFYYNYKEELLKEAHLFQKVNSKFMDNIFDVADEEFQPSINEVEPLLHHQETSKLFEEIGRIHQEEIRRMFEKSKWKKILIATLEVPVIRTIFALTSLLVFVLVVIQSSMVSPVPNLKPSDYQLAFDQKFNMYWLYIELGLNIFLLLDPVLRVISIGWKYFIESWFYMFELALSMCIITLIILKVSFFGELTMMVIRIFMLFRIWRFFNWVNTFEKYRLIFKTLLKLIPLFLDLLGVLTLAFYIYATIGEYMFGGNLKTNLNMDFASFGDPNYYVYVNFNDFAMGLYTCFHLLLVNNWLYTVDVHCRVMGSFGYRWFFVIFYIMTVVVCLNIMIAFILDLYVTQIGTKNRKRMRRNKDKNNTFENHDEPAVEFTPSSRMGGDFEKSNDGLEDEKSDNSAKNRLQKEGSSSQLQILSTKQPSNKDKDI